MKKILVALATAITLGLAGAANAVSFTIESGAGLFSDSARTILDEEFDVGQTIYGRIALGLEADDGFDPPGFVPMYGGPMELIGMDFFDDTSGFPVDPVDVLVGGLFVPTAPFSPTVMHLDFTLEFDLAGAFVFHAFSSPAIIAPDDPIPEAILDPGPLSFFVTITEASEGVPAPGALALLGVGLFGLGMRRRTS